MDKLPTQYSKVEFINFLRKNGITNGTINRIENLPDILHVEENNFNLNIVASWRDEGNTHYEFELNYYSPEVMEFLLPYKIFNDIDVSLNIVELELRKRGFID